MLMSNAMPIGCHLKFISLSVLTKGCPIMFHCLDDTKDEETWCVQPSSGWISALSNDKSPPTSGNPILVFSNLLIHIKAPVPNTGVHHDDGLF